MWITHKYKNVDLSQKFIAGIPIETYPPQLPEIIKFLDPFWHNFPRSEIYRLQDFPKRDFQQIYFGPKFRAPLPAEGNPRHQLPKAASPTRKPAWSIKYGRHEVDH